MLLLVIITLFYMDATTYSLNNPDAGSAKLC